MNKISIISPASKCSYRKVPAVDQGNWDRDFLARATKKDVSGFPLEGTFGISWATFFDISTVIPSLLEDKVVTAMLERSRAKGGKLTKKQAVAGAKQLIATFNNFKKGDIIALKQGTKVIAIVELTSNYTFCPEQSWGWHSWSYRLLKKVTDAEQPKNRGALIKTFMSNFLAMPELPSAPATV